MKWTEWSYRHRQGWAKLSNCLMQRSVTANKVFAPQGKNWPFWKYLSREATRTTTTTPQQQQQQQRHEKIPVSSKSAHSIVGCTDTQRGHNFFCAMGGKINKETPVSNKKMMFSLRSSCLRQVLLLLRFRKRTPFSRMGFHNLPYLPKWLPIHMEVNKFSDTR